MPIYEFECQKCKAQLEVYQKMNDKPPTKCKKCGGRLEKLVSASAIQFKGSGWYVTDYAGNGRKAAEKAEKAEKTEKDATTSATATDDKKSDKKTTESSPAKKTSDKASTTKVSSGD